MKKKFLFLCFVFVTMCVDIKSFEVINEACFTDSVKGIRCELKTIGDKTTELHFSYGKVYLDSVYYQGENFHHVKMDGVNDNNKAGMPNTPFHTELFVTNSQNLELKIIDKQYTDIPNIYLEPAMLPFVDSSIDRDVMYFNEEIYKTDDFYPKSIIDSPVVQLFKNDTVAIVTINPFQYNPVKKVLRCYNDIKISSTNILKEYSKKDYGYNAAKMASSFEVTNMREKYIIVTTDDFTTDIGDFVEWKKSLGYDVHVITKSYWASNEEVKDSILAAYNNRINSLGKYLLIIGDIDDVPSEQFYISYTASNGITYHDTYFSDHYYSCMDGDDDFLPELCRGRIPAKSHEDVTRVLSKSISYEQSPMFLSSGLHVGSFQTGSSSLYKENVPFIFTSEGILKSMQDDGYFSNISRVYRKSSQNAQPTFTYYNDSLPPALASGLFDWNGNSTDIVRELNLGKDYVLYRGHGAEIGWGSLGFYNPSLSSLTADKNVVVFSTTCHTGKYASVRSDGSIMKNNCFAYEYLAHSNAIGVIASTEKSFSRKNDCFVAGMFSNIYPSSSTRQNFSHLLRSGNHTEEPIYHMGEVMNRGLVEVINKYFTGTFIKHSSIMSGCVETFQRFHYFGDPSLEFYTSQSEDLSNIDVLVVNDSLIINTNGVSDCVVRILPISVSEEYKQYSRFDCTLNVECPSTPFKVLITKHNCSPVWKEPIYYIQNKSISNTKIIKADKFFAGRNVTNKTSTGDCVFDNGADIKIDGQKVVLDSGTIINIGTRITINKQ